MRKRTEFEFRRTDCDEARMSSGEIKAARMSYRSVGWHSSGEDLDLMAVKREAAQAQEQRGFAPVRMLVESVDCRLRTDLQQAK